MTFRKLLEDRQALKREYLKPKVQLKDIEKAFKSTKPDTVVKLTVKNPKSKHKQGIVTLMDIKGNDLLTSALATDSSKSAVFKIDDVISFDVHKI